MGSIVFLASVYHNIVSNSFPADQLLQQSPFPFTSFDYNQLLHEEQVTIKHTNSSLSSVNPDTTASTSPALLPTSISNFAILLPAWQVLVVITPDNTPLPVNSGEFLCLFLNNDVSPAHPSGVLPNPDRATFTCELPNKLRRRLPFPQPVLVKSPVENYPARVTRPPDMLRWDYLVYDVMFTDNDVVVFVKGVNKRQRMKRDPREFNCVFGDDVVNGVRTAVTSSIQEVFRCQLPDSTAVSLSSSLLVKVSIEFSSDKRVLPSIAYGSPARKLVATQEPKALLCACTMVYNVAKFLEEWVIYHSKIGVEKFILYDNESDDDLNKVVEELNKEGFDVGTKFWLWPKTQESGFSHCAISAKDSCTWMMYVDVDEFVYSDSWTNSSNPSKSMLQSLLTYDSEPQLESKPRVGEIMIACHEFGPSNQKSHPVVGVKQGYNCRKRMENRHKSIVLLDAIHDSLLNVIHHFQLKEGYRAKKINKQNIVVNHYKFQAWSEFKAKFRRRVSAYVVDWTQSTNLRSNDRTPGLGNLAVEPEGWPEKFCEVRDNGLKELSERWFGANSSSWLGKHKAERC